jgi:ABC-type nitrate/sulfonate/bicarbonate transport system substrate-binding protein
MKKALLALLAVCGLLFAASTPPALAKTKLSFAFVTDPTHEMYVYAIRKGIVKSDTLDLELVTLAIPALIQGFLGKQYDIVETSMISLPRAVERGLDVRMLFTAIGRLSPGPTLDIWVKKDSPVKSVHELKGKKIAVFGLGSTALTMIRVALAKEHRFNVELQGGDFNWVQLPTAVIPAAILRGETEAGCLLYGQVFEAGKTGEFRSIYSGVDVLTREAGARMVLPVIVGYPEKIAKDEAAYKEFNRMLVGSLRYASENKKEVAEAIAKTSNVSTEFLINVLDGIATFKTPVENEDLKALDYFWNAAKDVGLLKTVPSARSLAWQPAMQP